MESLEQLSGLYGNISTLIKTCKSRFSEIEQQQFESGREKILKESIVKETNKRLKEAMNNFFDEYENLKTILAETDLRAARLDRIPADNFFTQTDKPDEETETLRRIEGILERQEFISKIERLTDEEVINLYQGTLIKAERLRDALTLKVKSGELPREDAERILRLDANVRLSSMMEDSEYPVTGRKPLQDRLGRMVSMAKQNRSSEQAASYLQRTAEQLHSSVCFLLRDLSESSLKIRNWEETEDILANPGDKQVEFFLSQSEKYFSSARAEQINPSKNDNIPTESPLMTENIE